MFRRGNVNQLATGRLTPLAGDIAPAWRSAWGYGTGDGALTTAQRDAERLEIIALATVGGIDLSSPHFDIDALTLAYGNAQARHGKRWWRTSGERRRAKVLRAEFRAVTAAREAKASRVAEIEAERAAE